MGEPKEIGRRYSARLPDGTLWCESSDPEEVVRRSAGLGCTYMQWITWQHVEAKPWAPLECVNALCAKHYGGPADWNCTAYNPPEVK